MIALSVMSDMKSDVLPLKWVMMWTLYKSEGKPTSLPVRYKVQFFKSNGSWESNTGNYGIHFHCTLKYSIKNIIPIPVINLHMLVNVKIVLVMQHCWIGANSVYMPLFIYRTAQYHFHRTPAFRFPSWSFDTHHPAQKLVLHRTHGGQTTGASHSPVLYPSSCDLYFPPYRQRLQVSVWSTKRFVLMFSSCRHLWPPRYWKERALFLAQLEQGHLELTVLSFPHRRSWYHSLTWSTPKKSSAHFKLKSPSVYLAAF